MKADKLISEEADTNHKKIHKMADELPKKDFRRRYGKEKGDTLDTQQRLI